MGHYLSETPDREPIPDREYKSTFDAFKAFVSTNRTTGGSESGSWNVMKKFFEEFDEMKRNIERLEYDAKVLERQRDYGSDDD